MKKLLPLGFTLALLAGLSYVLWIGFHKHQDLPDAADDDDEAAPVHPLNAASAPPFTVILTKERAATLGLATAPLRKITHPALRQTFGFVLDPTPLVTLHSEIATAQAALTASQAAHQRTLALLATNDASIQASETSLAQFTTDHIKLQNLLHCAHLQWGHYGSPEPQALPAFIDQLVHGDTALIQVDPLPGEPFPLTPQRGHLLILGHENSPIPLSDIQPAPLANPNTHSPSLLLRVDHPPFPLPPGLALSAWLELPDPPQPGFAIPPSAILRHDGQSWVFLQQENDTYIRYPISLVAPLPGDLGWFTPTTDHLPGTAALVTTGAASLLSEERNASAPTAELD